MTGLPICPQTDLPRILCGCPKHANHFTMAPEERDYLDGLHGYTPPPVRPPGTVRPIPEYTGGAWTEKRDVKIADSSTICRTPGCTRPSGDAFVCAPCIDDLEVCLGDVPKLEEDLMVLTMRQARMQRNQSNRKRVENTKWDAELADSEDAQGIRKSGGRILAAAGYNRTLHDAQAAARLAYLNTALVSAVKQITEQRGLPLPTLEGPTEISRWLLGRVHAVAMDEGGGDIVADIKREHARAMHAIDCPPDLTYIGLCDACKAPMHADETQATFVCHDCGAEYDVAERVQAKHDRVMGSLLSLREIADLSAEHFGGKITVKQLEGLVRRDRLKVAAHRPAEGRHERIALYRAADVVTIMGRRRGDPDAA